MANDPIVLNGPSPLTYLRIKLRTHAKTPSSPQMRPSGGTHGPSSSDIPSQVTPPVIPVSPLTLTREPDWTLLKNSVRWSVPPTPSKLLSGMVVVSTVIPRITISGLEMAFTGPWSVTRLKLGDDGITSTFVARTEAPAPNRPRTLM